MSVVRVAEGRAVLSMPLTEDVRGYFEGSIHGGMLATFADAASASCLDDAYDFSTHFPVTTDLHVRYYRQPKGGPLIAEANLVYGGRRLLSTECSVVDAEDRVRCTRRVRSFALTRRNWNSATTYSAALKRVSVGQQQIPVRGTK